MTKFESLEDFKREYNIVQKKYDEAQQKFQKGQMDNDLYVQCLKLSNECIGYLDKYNELQLTNYKNEIKMTYFINSEILIRTVGINTSRSDLTEQQKHTFFLAINRLRKTLDIEPFYKPAQELFKLAMMYLTLYNQNASENLNILKQILLIDPCDYQVQYNLGFMYHRNTQLNESVEHYKLAIGIIDLKMQMEKDDKTLNVLKQFKIKCINGIGSVYYTVQKRDLAIYYFDLALQLDPLDPDVNNQMGVVYTELRMTEKAIFYYERGIENYKRAHISTDLDMLLASMYMNMGLAKCYECDFTGAIDGYNMALKYKPRLSLAYQNKLLDVNYISHLIDDPMYIAKLHKAINKIYPKVISNWREGCPNYSPKEINSREDMVLNGKRLTIGFVSGDFICHPVSYFIHSILKYINYDLFDVYCYSAKIVDLKNMFPQCKWFVVKNKTPTEFKSLIQSHNVDILFDLSGHTGDNRLDTFVLKPAPIQISYCGYPNSSGIRSMDYRITDRICDSEKSQKYYVENFVYMNHCFLAYTPSMGIENAPELPLVQPATENGYVTFGCFNRFNKVNEMVIGVWERILKACPTARFIIKTKEFMTPKIKKKFIETFKDQSVLERVIMLDYSDTYNEHLMDYNKIDIALDTFPYSGTTTSCEALMMGVPILTIFDNKRHYHSQNVTSSLMKNCNLDEYVTYSQDEYVKRASEFCEKIVSLNTLKQTVRDKFVNGHICDYQNFTNEFENKIIDVYKHHRW